MLSTRAGVAQAEMEPKVTLRKIAAAASDFPVLTPAAGNDPHPCAKRAPIRTRSGELEQNPREYRFAVRYAPEYSDAHWKLGELLLARSQRVEAEKHLRKAAESPDPRVRTAASRLLKALE